jgi:hypothetical protein
MLTAFLRGESFTLTDENLSSVWCLCHGLGNTELFEQVIDFSQSHDQLSTSNCISRVHVKSTWDVSIDSELDFISSHFYEFAVDSLGKLTVAELENILERDSLHISTEDDLLATIRSLGGDYSSLVKCVKLDFLSPEAAQLFLSELPHPEIDERLWSNVCRRASHRLGFDDREIPSNRYLVIVRSPGSPFCGLIHRLTEMCGGNVHERGEVDITCSGNGYNSCHQVAGEWSSWWHTTNAEVAWLQFDFKERRICVSHYALRSGGDGGWHMLEWTVEGSQDGFTWDPLDSRKTTELKGTFNAAVFACPATASQRFYRYVRLTRKGTDSNGSKYLRLSRVEFFGLLMERPPVKFSLLSL